MDFRILGPLEVVADGRVARLNAAKPRALLAILLLRAGEPIPSDRLIEDLWAGRPPATAVKVLQAYVSQLRKALGKDVDRHRAERLRAPDRAGSPRSAPLRASRERSARGGAAGRSPEPARGPRALARTATCRVRLRVLGARRDRPAGGASPHRASGSHRRGPGPRPRRRARRRARAPGRRAPLGGAPAGPAHARALPLGQAGGGTGRLPVGEGHPGGAARDRAGGGVAPPRAGDPRSGSGAGRCVGGSGRAAGDRDCEHDRPPSSAGAGSSGRFARCWARQMCAS